MTAYDPETWGRMDKPWPWPDPTNAEIVRLTAEVERLRAENAALRQEVEQWRQHSGLLLVHGMQPPTRAQTQEAQP